MNARHVVSLLNKVDKHKQWFPYHPRVVEPNRGRVDSSLERSIGLSELTHLKFIGLGTKGLLIYSLVMSVKEEEPLLRQIYQGKRSKTRKRVKPRFILT